MREILFRAKRKDSGQWTYGYLYGIWERKYICCGMTNSVPDMKEVMPETVSQFTGLTDRNGNRIWENDIICWRDVSGKYYHAVVKFGEYGNGDYGFYLKWIEDIGMRPNLSYWSNKVDVVGNVFDSTDLLEGENGNI